MLGEKQGWIKIINSQLQSPDKDLITTKKEDRKVKTIDSKI